MLVLVLTKDGKQKEQMHTAAFFVGVFDVFYLSTSIVRLPLPLTKNALRSPLNNKLTCLNLLF